MASASNLSTSAASRGGSRSSTTRTMRRRRKMWCRPGPLSKIMTMVRRRVRLPRLQRRYSHSSAGLALTAITPTPRIPCLSTHASVGNLTSLSTHHWCSLTPAVNIVNERSMSTALMPTVMSFVIRAAAPHAIYQSQWPVTAEEMPAGCHAPSLPEATTLARASAEKC